MTYTPEQLQVIHDALQNKAQESFETSIRIVLLASELARKLAEWKASLPVNTTVEAAAEALFTDDLQVWLPEYEKLAALAIREPVHEIKPRKLQQAMRLLDLIPTTIQKEKPNEEDKTKEENA